jgi:hypothetical protein
MWATKRIRPTIIDVVEVSKESASVLDLTAQTIRPQGVTAFRGLPCTGTNDLSVGKDKGCKAIELIRGIIVTHDGVLAWTFGDRSRSRAV